MSARTTPVRKSSGVAPRPLRRTAADIRPTSVSAATTLGKNFVNSQVSRVEGTAAASRLNRVRANFISTFVTQVDEVVKSFPTLVNRYATVADAEAAKERAFNEIIGRIPAFTQLRMRLSATRFVSMNGKPDIFPFAKPEGNNRFNDLLRCMYGPVAIKDCTNTPVGNVYVVYNNNKEYNPACFDTIIADIDTSFGTAVNQTECEQLEALAKAQGANAVAPNRSSPLSPFEPPAARAAAANANAAAANAAAAARAAAQAAANAPPAAAPAANAAAARAAANANAAAAAARAAAAAPNTNAVNPAFANFAGDAFSANANAAAARAAAIADRNSFVPPTNRNLNAFYADGANTNAAAEGSAVAAQFAVAEALPGQPGYVAPEVARGSALNLGGINGRNPAATAARAAGKQNQDGGSQNCKRSRRNRRQRSRSTRRH